MRKPVRCVIPSSVGPRAWDCEPASPISVGSAGTRAALLARAAERLGEREPIGHLKRIAAKAELSNEYGLVLR